MTKQRSAILVVAITLFAILANYKSLYSQFKTTAKPSDYAMGKVYVIALPDTVYSENSDPNAIDDPTGEEAWAYVYSAVENTLRITDVGNEQSWQLKMKAGEFKQIEILTNSKKVGNAFVTESFKPTKAALRIEAEQPVVCYVYVSMKQLAEIYTALPVEAWGTDYVVASLPAETVTNTSVNGLVVEATTVPAGGQALVIAVQDSTVVKFTPSCELAATTNNSVTLNANEAYLISSAVDTTTVKFDLSGTRISASKPISVISGSARARVNNDLSSITSNTCKNLLMDALAPTDAQGTQYVYMPTLDGKQPVTTNTQVSGKRQFELVRAYGTTAGKTTGKFLDPMTGTPTAFSLTENAVTPLNTMKFLPQLGRYIETDKPSQMVKFSSAVSAFDPNIRYVRRRGGVKDTIGVLPVQVSRTTAPYMVNLVPREQWVSFAPFFVPFGPNTDIENFYGVVTDSANKGKIRTESGTVLNFNKSIPRTPYVWAMGSINGGAHFIESTNGGKFYVEIFGVSTTGQETYIPGSANNAAEYDEIFSLAYGFPAAPNRFAYRKEDTAYNKLRKDLKLGYGDSLSMRLGDSISITESEECGIKIIEIKVLNTSPQESYVGLRSVELIDNSKSKLVNMLSKDMINVAGMSYAKLGLIAKDTLKGRKEEILIRDRSGKEWRRSVEVLNELYTGIGLSERLLDLGKVPPNNYTEVKELLISNPTNKNIIIKSIDLEYNYLGFDILNKPTLPYVLFPNDKLQIGVRFSSLLENKEQRDNLLIKTDCQSYSVSLTAKTGLNIKSVEGGVEINNKSKMRIEK